MAYNIFGERLSRGPYCEKEDISVFLILEIYHLFPDQFIMAEGKQKQVQILFNKGSRHYFYMKKFGKIPN